MAEVIGHGAQFQYGDGGGPEVFTTVAGVLSIDLGSNKVDAIDNTDMGVVGNQRTFLGGLENSGDVTVKLNVKPGDASQTALLGKKDAAQHNFKVIFPGAVQTWSFAAIVTSVDRSVPGDKIPTYTVKLQISGAVTLS